MQSEALLQHTTTRFPDFAHGHIRIEPLEKGGSDRKYYRLRVGETVGLILIKYGSGREENRHYVDIARFLSSRGLRVPHVYFHDEDEGLIWMQDLGEEDLWASRDEPWHVRRALYRSALDQALQLHTQIAIPGLEHDLTLQKEFNAELYLWEQDYFLENCLGRHFGLDLAGFDRAPLHALAEQLATRPRCLVHRDFQSQNVMIRDGHAWLIDFQGLRPGLAGYDVASLLYDPYATLTAGEREALLEDYITGAQDLGAPVAADFREVYRACAAQRLMQALGAYGYLGHVKERPEFLQHIPAALASLRQAAGSDPALAPLVGLLAQAPA